MISLSRVNETGTGPGRGSITIEKGEHLGPIEGVPPKLY